MHARLLFFCIITWNLKAINHIFHLRLNGGSKFCPLILLFDSFKVNILSDTIVCCMLFIYPYILWYCRSQANRRGWGWDHGFYWKYTTTIRNTCGYNSRQSCQSSRCKWCWWRSSMPSPSKLMCLRSTMWNLGTMCKMTDVIHVVTSLKDILTISTTEITNQPSQTI